MNKRIICGSVALALVLGLTSFVSVSASSTKEYDGNIEKGIAFASKHNIIQGNPNNDEDDNDIGLYYDMDDYLDEDDYGTTLGEKYGTKYVVLEEGLFDMSRGRLTDNTISDLEYDVVKDLKKELKDVSRYLVEEVSDVNNTTQQMKDRFGDVWYRSEVKRDSSEEQTCYIFYNSTKKNWMELSYKTKLYFYDKDKSNVVKIDELGKKNNGYTANVSDIKMLAQGEKNLFFKMDVEITKEEGNTDTLTYIIKTNKSSKSDSSVKYPSEINTYLVKSSVFADNSLDKVNSLLENATDFTVYKDKLYAISASSDITVTEIELSKDKVKLEDSETKVNMMVASIGDSDSLNTDEYCIDVNGKVWALYKDNVQYFNGEKFKEDTDVDSDIDKIDVYDENNAIFWSTEDELVTVKTGSSSSYDDDDDDKDDDEDDDDKGIEDEEDKDVDEEADNSEDSEDDEELGIVGGNANNETNNSDPISYKGHWEFGSKNPQWIKIDGSIGKNEWVYTNGAWYYVDEYGYSCVGWKQIDDVWYFLDESGRMVTGWKKIDGYWYFFNNNGSMATGWKASSQEWYYLNPLNDGYQGVMKTGWIQDGEDWYLLNSSGVMRKGWVKHQGTWYYFNYQGKMLKDCVVDGYYLSQDGSLQDISRRLNEQLREVKEQEGNSSSEQNQETQSNVDTSTGSTGLFGATNSSGTNTDTSYTFGATGSNGF